MQLAIITGGSRGLGNALCHDLANAGFELIEFSRSAPHRYSVPIDLSSPSLSRAIVAERLSLIDRDAVRKLLVINNAAILNPIGPADQKPANEVLANLNCNFTSAIVILAEIMRYFESLKCVKRIANISSGAARGAYPGWSLYCASKAGMESFIRCAALEQSMRDHPFDLININPGVMDTQMQEQIRSSSTQDFPGVQRFIERKNRGELASVEQVSAAVLNILSLPTLQSGSSYDVADY